jgi:hypothetical protein
VALDDFEERFAAAVKAALDASRTAGEEHSGAVAAHGCPSLDSISAYYEGMVSRSERTRLEAHFSGCSKCQGTLAALLRAAPEEAGHEARAQAGSIEPDSDNPPKPLKANGRAWRIAVIAAGTAVILAGAGIGGVYFYRSTGGFYRSTGETPQSHSSDLALNEAKSNMARAQSSPSAEASEAASAPARLVSPPTAAPGASMKAGGQSGVGAEQFAPTAADSGEDKHDAQAASADQAAAALGALASIPAPPAAAVSSAAARPSAAQPVSPKFAANHPAASAKTPAGADAQSRAGNRDSALNAKPPGAAGAAAAGAKLGALASSPPALTRSTAAASTTSIPPAGKAIKRQPTAHPEAAHRTPAKASPDAQSKIGAGPNPNRTVASPPQSSEVARQALADEKRRAKLIREAKAQAEKESKLKEELAKARREARTRAEIQSAMINVHPRPQPVRIASAPPLKQLPIRANSTTVTSSASPPVPSAVQSPAKAVTSAPVVAAIAPGIPVAPRASLVASPDHRVYWSLQNSGVIYRTNDRKSWTPQFSGTTADLLAGMAPSDTVCWAVGRNGTILLSTDGAHWERIKPPTKSDVTGVIAAGKDVATIFTADGRSYSTWDGGSNWQPVK